MNNGFEWLTGCHGSSNMQCRQSQYRVGKWRVFWNVKIFKSGWVGTYAHMGQVFPRRNQAGWANIHRPAKTRQLALPAMPDIDRDTLWKGTGGRLALRPKYWSWLPGFSGLARV